ncbi:MAG: ABC transporter ATP-binding protein [Acidobacteria bacterium]|nr:ABC transporter ATP-binding protein [Acidobacteriota bacterium]
MIVCDGLTKRFGEFNAVDSATFQTASGSVCALLGPNGAGKSTLVKMLTGLLPPTAGNATVAGLPIGTREARAVSGVLPENMALFDGLTIQEHLDLTAAVHETPGHSEPLLRRLGLLEARDTFINQCSYGMRKKTALAMALLTNPKVLFLDEPFEGLDPVTTQTLRGALRALAARGVTIFLTSHILSLVDCVADQILILRGGRIVLDSPIRDLPGPVESQYFEAVEAEGFEWFDQGR